MVKNEVEAMMENRMFVEPNNHDNAMWQRAIPLTTGQYFVERDTMTDDRTDAQTDVPMPTVVREHLKHVIRNRRSELSETIEADDHQSARDGEEELSPEEIQRIDRRRYLNKQAAQRCRDKKKGKADQLETEVLELEAKNTELRHAVRKLTREKEELRSLLLTHFDVFHGGQQDIPGDVL